MQQVTIFNGLSENEINLLMPLLESFTCEAGTIILQQGSPAEFLYFLTNGIVEMSFKPYDGNPITVSHIEKGGLFGWSSVVGSKKYTSSAIAIDDVEAFRVRGVELRKFCREHPETGKDILEHLADGVSSRWKDAHQQVKSMLAHGIAQREC